MQLLGKYYSCECFSQTHTVEENPSSCHTSSSQLGLSHWPGLQFGPSAEWVRWHQEPMAWDIWEQRYARCNLCEGGKQVSISWLYDHGIYSAQMLSFEINLHLWFECSRQSYQHTTVVVLVRFYICTFTVLVFWLLQHQLDAVRSKINYSLLPLSCKITFIILYLHPASPLAPVS